MFREVMYWYFSFTSKLGGEVEAVRRRSRSESRLKELGRWRGGCLATVYRGATGIRPLVVTPAAPLAKDV
jgi:hypothetical protein